VFLEKLHVNERFLPGGGEYSIRSHLAWSKRRNVNLKELTTQRCLKGTVVVTLIVNANTGILFSSSDVATSIRSELKDGKAGTLGYWVGLSVCVSVSRLNSCQRTCYFS
jgi:hypothetical protein